MITTNAKTVKRYRVLDVATGKPIWMSGYNRARKYALRKTKTCAIPWNTNASAWDGDMAHAVKCMSKQYGKPVRLEEDGTQEVIEVSF